MWRHRKKIFRAVSFVSGLGILIQIVYMLPELQINKDGLSFDTWSPSEPDYHTTLRQLHLKRKFHGKKVKARMTSRDNATKTSGSNLPLMFESERFFKEPYRPLIYGKYREKRGYLTVGIPTVRRPTTDRIYLLETLESLIGKLSETDKDIVTIAVLVADVNTTYNQELGDRINEAYHAEVQAGLIQVIQPPLAIYPSFEKVRNTYNDPLPRLRWRAKQNIDFAYLMMYSHNISEYYIQIEDDLLTASGFVQEVQNFINSQGKQWFLLEFSNLGFIGKLFHSDDLSYVASKLLAGYDSMPCDLLLGSIRMSKNQRKPIHSNISLFQHIGWFSSLENKLVPSLDDKYKDKNEVSSYIKNNLIIGDNPPASVLTNMRTVSDKFSPMNAYDGNLDTYYWAREPKTRDYFMWAFDKPHRFSRIVVQTGDRLTRKDILLSADLHYAGPQVVTADHASACDDRFKKMGTLTNGALDSLVMGIRIPVNIKCLRLSVKKRLRSWVIIQDIQVFVGTGRHNTTR